MYRTLKQLQDSIQRLIELQGEDAPVVGFIFTKEDVQVQELTEDDDFLEIDCDSLEECYPGIVDTVLERVGDHDYIYEQVFEMIEDAIRLVRNTK
jgi:chaperonin GroEL (HSP60 family)